MKPHAIGAELPTAGSEVQEGSAGTSGGHAMTPQREGAQQAWPRGLLSRSSSSDGDSGFAQWTARCTKDLCVWKLTPHTHHLYIGVMINLTDKSRL